MVKICENLAFFLVWQYTDSSLFKFNIIINIVGPISDILLFIFCLPHLHFIPLFLLPTFFFVKQIIFITQFIFSFIS